jgi:hypothetical protein
VFPLLLALALCSLCLLLGAIRRKRKDEEEEEKEAECGDVEAEEELGRHWRSAALRLERAGAAPGKALW